MSSPSMFRILGLRFVDLVILAIALLYVTTSAVATGTFQIISLDFVQVVLVVFLTYLGTSIFVNVLVFSFPTNNWILGLFKGLIYGLVVAYIFAPVLSIAMWFAGYVITADSQNVLFWVMVIRAVARGLLGQFWERLFP